MTKKKTGFAAILFASIGALIAQGAGFGYVLMLLVGIVHANWFPALPTLGYGTAFPLGILTVSLNTWLKDGPDAALGK